MSVPKRERGLAPRVQSRPQAFLFCALSALFILVSNAEARRHHVRQYSSSPPAAMAMDLYTGRVLYSKNSDSPRYPASVTKVMTLYLLFDALRDGKLTMRTQLHVSEHAAEQSPTKLGLLEGDTIAVADAIGAIVTKSANDMAVTVAEALAGSEEEFARRMTQKARTIGMLNTTFRNASGLPNSEQKTTAQDLIILGKNILADHPERSRVFATKYFQYRGEIMRNHNSMLFSYEGMEGMKTGFTSSAGFNLLASAHRGDKRILAVVLGGESPGSRNAAMRNILDASWSKAMTQMAARKSGIAVASLRRPVEVTVEHPRRIERAQEERLEKKAIAPGRSVAAATLAPAAPQAALQLKQKPDALSSGMLIASIENGLVARQPLARPEPAVTPSDMTTDEPEEKAEAAEGQSVAPPAPQEIAGNETLVAQAQPVQLQNVSIHYKTARQVEVEPLDAVSLDAPSIEPQIVKAQAASAIKVQATSTLKVQAAAAVEQEDVKPQRLANATLPVSREIVDHPGPYYVQVGSFADEAQAAQRLESVKETLGAAVLKAHPEFVVPVALSSGVTMYRARLGRFADESQAKSACKKLRKSGIECWDMRAR
ncbi:MAG: D-alanyl-D-alanine carboxypeptidase [Rhodomicrobium sp.]